MSLLCTTSYNSSLSKLRQTQIVIMAHKILNNLAPDTTFSLSFHVLVLPAHSLPCMSLNTPACLLRALLTHWLSLLFLPCFLTSFRPLLQCHLLRTTSFDPYHSLFPCTLFFFRALLHLPSNHQLFVVCFPVRI